MCVIFHWPEKFGYPLSPAAPLCWKVRLSPPWDDCPCRGGTAFPAPEPSARPSLDLHVPGSQALGPCTQGFPHLFLFAMFAYFVCNLKPILGQSPEGFWAQQTIRHDPLAPIIPWPCQTNQPSDSSLRIDSQTSVPSPPLNGGETIDTMGWFERTKCSPAADAHDLHGGMETDWQCSANDGQKHLKVSEKIWCPKMGSAPSKIRPF